MNTIGKIRNRIQAGLTLHTSVGTVAAIDSTGEEVTLNLSSSVPNGEPFVTNPKTGDQYRLAWEEIVNLAVQAGILGKPEAPPEGWEYDLSKAVPEKLYVVAMADCRRNYVMQGCYRMQSGRWYCMIPGCDQQPQITGVYAFLDEELPELPPLPGEEVEE